MDWGTRPDPETYLSKEFMNDHLARFEDGAIRITTREKLDHYGTAGADGDFIIPLRDFSKLLKTTGGSPAEIERVLALEKGL